MSVENGGPERQTVSDGGRRDGKNTENPSRLSILLTALSRSLPTHSPTPTDTEWPRKGVKHDVSHARPAGELPTPFRS